MLASIYFEHPDATLSIGQWVLAGDGSIYLLSQVEANRVALIGLFHGNRLVEPISVSKATAITAEEFRAMCGYSEGLRFEDMRLIRNLL